MSDIFNPPPPEPDPKTVDCWECGRLAEFPCSDLTDKSCDSRRSKANFTQYIMSFRSNEDDPYWDGFNDAIDMVVSRLKGSNG